MNRSPIRILVADDHYVVRAGLQTILNAEKDFEVVGTAENGAEAVAGFRQTRPDVVLIDLKMPVLDGLGAMQGIREMDPAARILILTTYEGDEDVHRALRAGARGYLLKRALAEELADAVRTVFSGGSYIPAEIARKLAERLAQPSLTGRELDVLYLMAKGLSNKEIGGVLQVSENTAKNHVSHILTKLGVADRAEAATAALQRGIIHLD